MENYRPPNSARRQLKAYRAFSEAYPVRFMASLKYLAFRF